MRGILSEILVAVALYKIVIWSFLCYDFLKFSSAWCSTSSLFTSMRKRYSVLQYQDSGMVIQQLLSYWASSRGEVTLMVCADYSKAFDTVQFRSVVSKMHSLGFSKYFLLGGSNLQVAGCRSLFHQYRKHPKHS